MKRAPTTAAAAAAAVPTPEEYHDDIIYPAMIPFLLVHFAAFAAIWTGITLEAVILGIALYFIRMFAATAGYHRYFSHRTYRTSRVGQFLLAVLCQTTAQRGILWWAAKHRHHHRYSDTELDVHSPRQRGFWYAHLGWIFSRREQRTSYDSISDLTKYPELVWLDRHPYLIPALLAVVTFGIAGWPGLIVGFFWSTVVLFHAVFMINSLAHVHGKQRYLTGDDSRNNWWLAVITLGEGWHNNHHAYQSSTRQGFRWWEIDVTYYILRVLSWTGLIWDLRDPPAEVVNNERRLGRAVVEKAARQLVASFPVDHVAQQVREAWVASHHLDDMRRRARDAQVQLEARLAAMALPQLPSVEEMRRTVERMYANAPAVSMDEIAERARQLLLRAVSMRLLGEPEPQGA